MSGDSAILDPLPLSRIDDTEILATIQDETVDATIGTTPPGPQTPSGGTTPALLPGQ